MQRWAFNDVTVAPAVTMLTRDTELIATSCRFSQKLSTPRSVGLKAQGVGICHLSLLTLLDQLASRYGVDHAIIPLQ
jgi:hypothetical protein